MVLRSEVMLGVLPWLLYVIVVSTGEGWCYGHEVMLGVLPWLLYVIVVSIGDGWSYCLR